MLHREPILSFLAAGPTSQQTDQASTKTTADNDGLLSVKRTYSRQRKTAPGPGSNVGEPASSVPVGVIKQDSGGRQHSQAVGIRTQLSGQCIMVVLVELSDKYHSRSFLYVSALPSNRWD